MEGSGGGKFIVGEIAFTKVPPAVRKSVKNVIRAMKEKKKKRSYSRSMLSHRGKKVNAT